MQIFEVAGLGVVPGQFWPFLQATPAPGDAVINFLAALGLNPDLVRAKDRVEVERANDVLDLLVDIDGAFTKLSEKARADVQTAIWCGEYERVRDAAQIVRTYLAILELGDAFPDDRRFPAFTSFLGDVAAELENPMSAERADAEAAERIRVGMGVLLRQLADATSDAEDLIKLLWLEFPDWQHSPQQDDIKLALSRIDETLASIRNEPHPPTVVGELLDHVERFILELRTMLAAMASARRSRAHGSSGSSKGRSKGDPFSGAAKTTLDKALAYFGLNRARLPTLTEFKKIKKKFQFKTHPDHGGTSEQFHDCLEFARTVEDHLAPA